VSYTQFHAMHSQNRQVFKNATMSFSQSESNITKVLPAMDKIPDVLEADFCQFKVSPHYQVCLAASIKIARPLYYNNTSPTALLLQVCYKSVNLAFIDLDHILMQYTVLHPLYSWSTSRMLTGLTTGLRMQQILLRNIYKRLC